MTMINILTALIKNGNGISVKSFFLLAVTIVGCIILLSISFAMIWDVITNGYLKSDLLSVSALIGSITTLFGAAGFTKVASEKYENNNNNE